MVRLFISCVVVAALANTAFADAKATRRAKEHIAKGTKAYQAGRYEDARKEFATAYSLDPQPSLLFALGDVNVKLGRCEAAITFLEKYLETKPEESQTIAANDALAACNATPSQPAEPAADEAQIEIDPGKVEPPPPTGPAVPGEHDKELPPGIVKRDVAPAAAPMTVDETPSERAWYLDPVGLAMCGGGALAVVTGAVVLGVAVGKSEEASAAQSYEDALGLRDQANTMGVVAIISASVGVALIGGGTYFYMQRRAETRVTAAPTTNGAIIGLTGRF